MNQLESSKSFIWWLITFFGIPITFPWMIYHLFNIMKMKQQKEALREKVVVITGASSGLGESLAHTFYSFGCKIILIARRTEELERVKNDLIHKYHTIPTHPPIILSLDLTEINNLSEEMNKILKIHGKIDILINNAGISYRGDIETTELDVDIKVMLINYFAQIALAKAVLPSMIKRKYGHIVCISSVQGKIALPYRSAYGASKHALQAWCDSARAELIDENIKITVVNPGYIKTDLSINAVTASGQKYGKMDKTIKNGYSPAFVAQQILKAVLRQDKEIIIAPINAKAACFIRNLIPSFYFKIMEIRARNINN